METLKPFTMPKWGIEMSEGTLADWQIEEGKPFKKGAIIALIETDKITNEIEAEADGCLVRLIASAQQTLPVGALLAVAGPADAAPEQIDAFIAAYKPAGRAGEAASEEAADPAASTPATSQPATSQPATSQPVAASQPATSQPPASKVEIAADVAISPAARRAAENAGISAVQIVPSGRNGRITRQDVDRAIAGSKSPQLKGPIAAPGQETAFASPLARRIAVQNGIDLGNLAGSGPRGRICKADVLAVLSSSADLAQLSGADISVSPSASGNIAPAMESECEIVPMTSMRRTIARRLTEAKQNIPHIYLRRRVRADRLIALRERDGKVGTINDYLVRACALALREVPAVNVQVHDNAIHRFSSADIAIAVATERGLITPIVHGADDLDVATLGRRTAELAQRARAGKLRPEEFQGGSFSISNLGGYGVEEFDAVINPPQGAILAVGRARPEPIDDAGAIRIVPVLHLSLSCDHRAIDGVDGARFLDALADLLEHPERL